MNNFWKNKRVFITGHTGFKGTWLSLFLSHLGGEVTGYSLAPPTTPSLFELTDAKNLLNSNIGDIRDYNNLLECMQIAEPEIIFHLAAQPIVRESYNTPLETFSANIIGTANLLEAARYCSSLKAVVNVTTDKCYENDEASKSVFIESDKLGGHDPYSASKACSEIVTASYRQSFFNSEGSAAVATARAGNVIGGGDWGKDRLLPDFFRAVEAGETFFIRKPEAVRPWQHVLDAVNGYITLAEGLYNDGQKFAQAWNIGPDEEDFISVRALMEKIVKQWPSEIKFSFGENKPDLHEASCLALDCKKIKEQLAWKSCWNTDKAVESTVSWFSSFLKGEPVRELCIKQIEDFLGNTNDK